MVGSHASSQRSNTFQYVIGYAQGFFGNDTVRFGNKGTKQLVVNATRFGQADEIADAFTDRPIDGILGLAFSWLSSDFHAPPFQYATERGLVDPVFTVYMKHAGGSEFQSFWRQQFSVKDSNQTSIPILVMQS
ncbi:hypothetical protein ANCCAN_08620 [Ancylostoma caninum]|uniref:Peptidase A1 domain-containing protein n=1 Tax=Ancylostoma caninum TaxID=29170 RepID=A0A368GQ40_ANCCA|nr:hypothetical protein ANCCAN_08620 [Ancylostoma caninum]